MTRGKDRGTRWESACVEHLRAHGSPNAERRALHGADDRGDIAGVPGAVIECKAEVRFDLAGWTAELVAEMANDGSKVGFVWAKRTGRTSPADGYAILPPVVLLRLLAEAGYIGPESDWLGDPQDRAVAASERRQAEILRIAEAYHHAGPTCGPESCPGVLDCVYADTLSLDGFAAVYDQMGGAA